MSAGEEMIVVFIGNTSRTVGTFLRVPAMNDATNRQKSMRPLEEEVWMTGFLIAQDAVEVPIDVTCKGPLTGAKDGATHGKIKD